MGIWNAHAVWLGDKLCLGGGETSGSERDDARLYIYTPATDTWKRINTPMYCFSLITYQSQLVLVGGREYIGEQRGPVTNELWTLTEHNQWRETVPPIIFKRERASAVEFADSILVAGGLDDEGRGIDIVEIYNGHHWAIAQHLPKPCYCIKSTILSGHWYLMGGLGQGKEVYCASLDTLIASCLQRLPYVWKRFPDVPQESSSTAVVGKILITVGGGYPPSSSIHAYSPHTQSWVCVGNIPVKLSSACTAVLPTGELVIIGGESDTSLWASFVYKASLNGNNIIMSSNSMLECMVNVLFQAITL